MDLTVIRIKRSLDHEPLQHIGISSKRMKFDTSVSVVATVESKEEPLAELLQNVASKIKSQKTLLRLQTLKSVPHKDLHKHKTTPSVTLKATSASESRYNIVSKARGITQLDSEIEKYISESEKLSQKNNESENATNTEIVKSDSKVHAKETDSCATPALISSTSSNVSLQEDGSKASTSSVAGNAGIDIEVLDVDHNSVTTKQDEDVICMNGVPLEKTYVYDIFLARLPKGHSVDQIDSIEQVFMDTCNNYGADFLDEADQDADSDDSNAEDNYRNDYPEGDDESLGSGTESDDDGGYRAAGGGIRNGFIMYDKLISQLGHFSLAGEFEDNGSVQSYGRLNNGRMTRSTAGGLLKMTNADDSDDSDSNNGSYAMGDSEHDDSEE